MASISKTTTRKALLAVQAHMAQETIGSVPPREGRKRRVSAKVAEQLKEAEDAIRRKEQLLTQRAARQKKAQIRQDKAAGITQDVDDSELEPRADTQITSRSVKSKPAAVSRRMPPAIPQTVVVKRVGRVPPPPSQQLIESEPEDEADDQELDAEAADEDSDDDNANFEYEYDNDQDCGDDNVMDEDVSQTDYEAAESMETLYDGEVVNMGLPITARALLSKPLPNPVILNLHDQPSKSKRPCSNSPDLAAISPPLKAQKVTDNGGRPKASDYDDVGKELILGAATYYRCFISTRNGFPDSATETDFVREAWTLSNEQAGMEQPYTLTPDIARIVKQRGSQTRGEIKSKTADMVETLYGFASGQGRRTTITNRAQVEKLKHEKGFIYKTLAEGSRKGIYGHEIIQKIVNKMWFQNRRDEGVVHSEMFNPLPVPAIALVLTAIECCIDEWATGIKTDITFWAEDYRHTYRKHIESLQAFGRATSKHELLQKLQTRLHNFGRLHSGATPLIFEDIQEIPPSAFANAIKEYEEDDVTEDDGECE